MTTGRVNPAAHGGDNLPARGDAQPRAASGSYYVRPCWIVNRWCEDGGYGYFAAVETATGRTLVEDDDLTVLMMRMADVHPGLALVENSVTLGSLRSVPKEGRL